MVRLHGGSMDQVTGATESRQDARLLQAPAVQSKCTCRTPGHLPAPPSSQTQMTEGGASLWLWAVRCVLCADSLPGTPPASRLADISGRETPPTSSAAALLTSAASPTLWGRCRLWDRLRGQANAGGAGREGQLGCAGPSWDGMGWG